MIPRLIRQQLQVRLTTYPAVALIGPRQCGKTTLARSMSGIYFDLEQDTDRLRLDLDWDTVVAGKKMVILDEAQSWPEIFPRLRGAIDRNRKHMGRFLILGSASRDLSRQSSESLAGRIRYLELTPFQLTEPHGVDEGSLLLRGGFPDAALAVDDDASFEWRLDFIRSFLERDVPGLMPRVSVASIRRLWQMLAHVHGQLLNVANLANARDVSARTVRHHIEILPLVLQPSEQLHPS